MKLLKVRESRIGRSIAKVVIQERLSMDLPTMIENGRVKGRLSVIPIYSIRPINFGSADFDSANRAGWRYFCSFENQQVDVFVDVTKQKSGSPAFAAYGKSRMLFNLEHLADDLRKRERQYSSSYHPRILRFPWAFDEVLWLCPANRKYKNLFVKLATPYKVWHEKNVIQKFQMAG